MEMPKVTPRSAGVPLCFGYIRVSTHKQAKYGISLEEQPDRIVEYFHRHVEPEGVAWGGIFAEKPVSAKKVMFKKRPIGRDVFSTVQSGDHLVLDHLSRAFRNMRDICNTVHDLQEMGVVVHFRDLGTDVRTPSGKMLMYALGMAAEMHSAILSERAKECHAYKKSKGIKHLDRRTITIKGPSGKRTQVPNSWTLEKETYIHKRRNEGATFEQIVVELDRMDAERLGETFNGRGRFDQRRNSATMVGIYFRHRPLPEMIRLTEQPESGNGAPACGPG